MEEAGLVQAGTSVASLYQTAVDCFENVRVSRYSNFDFQTSCLRFVNAQLRLTRWGKAAGIARPMDSSTSLQEPGLSQERVDHVRDLLGDIIQLFQQADRTSKRPRDNARQSSVEFATVADVIPQDVVPLYRSTREICLERQESTGWTNGGRLALYKRQHLSNIIEQVQHLLSSLVELSPTTQPMYESLCDEEAEVLKEKMSAAWKDVLAQHDQMLQDAVARLEKKDVSAMINTQYETFAGYTR